MTNEKIYENVMGHKPNKEFGVKGSFSWDDIDALMNAVKNCSIPAVVGQSEQLKAFLNEIANDKTYILNDYYKNKAKRLSKSL